MIVLLENISNSPWADMEDAFEGIGYSARAAK